MSGTLGMAFIALSGFLEGTRQSFGSPRQIDILLTLTQYESLPNILEKNISVFDTNRTFATIDHSIPTKKNRTDYADESAKNQVETLMEEGVAIKKRTKTQDIINAATIQGTFSNRFQIFQLQVLV